MNLSSIFLQIINGTNSQPLVLPDFTFLLAQIASIAVAAGILIITWRSMKKSNQLTQESNELLKNEMEARLKPVLIIDRNARGIHKDQPEQYRLFGELVNYGVLPARNVREYNYMKESQFGLEELLRNEKEIKSSLMEHHTILPNNSLAYSSTQGFDKTAESDRYLAIWLQYDFLDDRKEEVIHVFQIKAGREIGILAPINYTQLLQTHVDQDIKTARKRRDDLDAGKISAGF